MQAVIMAAGKGSRLGELTKDKPKSFVEIQDIKLIEYNLAMLHKYGIEDIYIVTGYMNERFEALTSNDDNITCVFNPFFESVNVLGSFYMVQDKVEDDFVYLHADTLCDPYIFEKMISIEGDMVLPVDFRPCDEEAMKVKTSEGKVVLINKTMSLEDGEGEFIGMAKISKNVLPELKEASKQLMKEKDFTSYFEGAIQRMIDVYHPNIVTIPTEGKFWGEIDFLEDYEDRKSVV